VIEAGRGEGAFVPVPFDVEEAFGTRGQVRVIATYDGVEDRTNLAPMGGRHVVGLRKSVRARLDKGAGESVTVTLVRDAALREIEMPPVLIEALAGEPDASAFFDSLSFTHRKEIARSISYAKRPETRERRLAHALEPLRNHKKPGSG